MLIERELTGEQLWQELLRVTNDAALRDRMATAARERARPQAARDIARKLGTLLEQA